jgi:phosphotransferase system enzyme I (PtsP)
MTNRKGVESRILLQRLRGVMAEAGAGQERLDKIVRLIAESMDAEVCSIYLRRDERTLELCATEGLNPEAVHNTRMRIDEGLVGRVAKTASPVNEANAPAAKGFSYKPETGEEIYSSFLGVPISRLGAVLGVVVVQNRTSRSYSEDEIYGLEIVAMVLAEMTELGVFGGPDEQAAPSQHSWPFFVRGLSGQEGTAEGVVLLHEAHIIIANPVADDPDVEMAKLAAAFETLQAEVDGMLAGEFADEAGEHRDVLNAYRLFAQDRGWRRRMEASIDSGLAAIVAVEKEQTSTRTRMERVADPYIRERLHDLDDLSNRLLRILAGGEGTNGRDIPDKAILVARNIGPGELLDYQGKICGVVLEEGSVGSHAAIVARALAIPLVIQADHITREAFNGDPILVDGDAGVVHLRPEEKIVGAFREKLAMQAEAQHEYAALRHLPAQSRDGVNVQLLMNAGLIADLPSLRNSGAEGVGLYRTELQFLIHARMPRRNDLVSLYTRVMDAAGDLPVTFRTLDIGSDKVLPYLRHVDEPNPALGWRAIRVALDRPGVMRMQLQALIRAAKGRPLRIMFPFVAEMDEYMQARDMLHAEIARESANSHPVPEHLEIGAMLETPSLAYAPDLFFQSTDFVSIGGNDLKQFFFAADRENELVRRRYDMLNLSFLRFIEHIVQRCAQYSTALSFCGEDAGRPLEAVALAAMGLRNLSMRPASVGPVKRLLRLVDLVEAREVIDKAQSNSDTTARPALMSWLAKQDLN